MAGDSFLTGGDLRGLYKNTISVDQVAAAELSQYTRFPYLLFQLTEVLDISQEPQHCHLIPPENQFPLKII